MFFKIFTILTWLASLVSVLPAWHFIIEVLTSMSHYLLFSNLAVLVGAFWGYQKRISKVGAQLAACIFVIYFLQPISPFYFTPKLKIKNDKQAHDFSVHLSNVELHKGNITKLQEQLSAQNTDFVVLLEVNQKWLDRLDLTKKYKSKFELPAENHFGLAVYSNFDIQSAAVARFGDELTPHVVFSSEYPNGSKVEFIIVHALPPLSANAIRHNRVLLRRIANYVLNSRHNIVLLGDFNGSIYNDNLVKLLKFAKMQHAAYGFGWYSSWHARNPFLSVMIDHVLYKGQIRVKNFDKLASIESDHYPLAVRMRVGE